MAHIDLNGNISNKPELEIVVDNLNRAVIDSYKRKVTSSSHTLAKQQLSQNENISPKTLQPGEANRRLVEVHKRTDDVQQRDQRSKAK